jgi:hypothetical protein
LQGTNLLAETVKVLSDHDKTPEDVLCVISGYGVDKMTKMSWARFAETAKDIEYDSGYGCWYILSSLKVLGPDWWLERAEYDGSEWWEFKSQPAVPDTEFEGDPFEFCLED